MDLDKDEVLKMESRIFLKLNFDIFASAEMSYINYICDFFSHSVKIHTTIVKNIKFCLFLNFLRNFNLRIFVLYIFRRFLNKIENDNKKFEVLIEDFGVTKDEIQKTFKEIDRKMVWARAFKKEKDLGFFANNMDVYNP